MFLWIFILIPVTYSYGQIREAEYECGAHGRFEYCIDGIPGCVVGCHCHPGYYFDTDTKICEPNVKLSQNFRRNYDLFEPTRVYLLPTPPVEDPTTTEPNDVDEKIDVITKDADDLGDWLYNQFFKTIENQVINETKDDTTLTRRSESSPSFLKKPTRRSHKYWRAKRKKKKRRKGLKSKLLRITEDDSLFDSSSDSTSDESSDSSSSASYTSEEKVKEKKKSSDHGHKKIVVFNKRPKPPLPSFIFLPNMETPFFPPIGLPPPPIPMYPMVPVPPMMGPYPFPGAQGTNQNESTTSASAGSTTGPVSTASNDATTNIPNTVPDVASTADTIPDTADQENAQDAATHADDATENPSETKLRNRSKLRRGPRNKLMKKLREQLKRKNKLQNYFANEYQDPESPMDIDSPPECIANPVPNRPKAFPEMYTGEKMPGMQDVDFKYLSQLIHRANLNKTNQNPPTVPPSNELMKNVITVPPPSRRNYYDNKPNEITKLLNNLSKQPAYQIPNQHAYNPPVPRQLTHNVPYRKKIEETNDVYYANLGRQIASMIRNIDGEGDVDIEIEKSNPYVKSQPPFNGNGGSQSYWERSVRSPFKILNSSKKEMNDLKKSNENLFSLENKVEIAAATIPTLSLQELENIISKVERAKTKLRRNRGKLSRVVESSKTSFNVNLLPDSIYSYHSNKNRLKDNNENTIGSEDEQTIKRSYNNNANINRQNAPSTLQPEPRNSFLNSFLFLSQNSIGNQNKSVVGLNNNATFLLPTTRPQTGPQYDVPKVNVSSYAYTVLPVPSKPVRKMIFTNIKLPPLKPSISKMKYDRLSPMIQNYKKVNYYYTGNNNQYKMEKTSIPVKYPTLTNYVEPFGKRVSQYKPSYFHHESNHFDYFDNFF